MKSFSKQITGIAAGIFTLAALVVLSTAAVFAQTQVSNADLAGTVVDPNGAAVPGATVTAKSSATNITRTVTANNSGEFQLIGLPPGEYDVTVEAATFKKTVITGVKLTVGQSASIEVKLELGTQDIVVNVSGDSVELIETTRTSVANTIDQARISALPTNERSATGFSLTLSTVGRDNGRPIGPAPTSGLNIGGQRGRSTQINVDGADFTDNSINASRSTVSQEAVQEYQISTNSYSAEFGRATGGVVNVVTKRGTNSFNGNVFGFIRDKNIQARNAFSPIDKPDYRRTQWGATLGGPIVKEKAFFFTAFERRVRDESGFFTSDVVGNLTSSVTVGAPFLPFTQTFNRLTSQQAAFANTLIGSGVPANINAAIQYLYLASSGGNTALLGSNPLLSVGGAIPAGSAVGARFVLSGAPVPIGTVNATGEPIAFRPLNSLQRIFPITERTSYFTVRGDVNVNADNQLTMRFGFNPSDLTGIQVESQNQSLGQNDFSRTGITEIKDYSFSAGLNSTINASMANEFYFSYGRRDTTFRSQNGDAVAFNISGTAFIGRELFSPVDRTENRYQFRNNFNWIVGDHSLKFGGDFNWVKIPAAVFELNFAGLFNFGDFAASNLGFPTSAPAFTPVQSYGLGLPSIYIQGFGDPVSKIKNQPIAFFGQDSWKVNKRLTINYGIRYDVEFTETIAPVGLRDPLSGITLSAADILTAQNAVGVQQGIPRDMNNWAPRFGFAYDIFGDGKTVVRGSLGYYYDHPLLVVAFNSDIADASQQQQAVLTAGSPATTSLLNAAQVFQGTVCVPGAPLTAYCASLPAGTVTPGVATTANYQFGRMRFNDQTYSGFGAVLPFTLPIASDFKYASATQANLTLERQLTKDMSLSVSYLFVGAHNLPHPTDLNSPNSTLQIENFRRFAGAAFPVSSITQTLVAAGVSIPVAAAGTPFTNAFGNTCAVVIGGMIAQCPGGRVVTPAIANFFRPNAPNYFLASALSGGAVSKAVLDSQLGGSVRTPGSITPFGSVNAQISDGNSEYNAMNVELKRRFSNNLQFLMGYTWSHSIDDSSDLQTLLIAQDVRNFGAERANSLFDQRHRFVFSGVLTSPDKWRKGNGWQKFLSDFAIAPIVELSSGRPFNIITNVDANNDQTGSTDRPNVLSNGTLCVPGDTVPGGAICGSRIVTDSNGQLVFSAGNLGRNMGLTHMFFSVDMRLTRAIRFGERFRIDLIAEGFNLFNRFNEGSASPTYQDVNAFGQRAGNGRFFSRSTAAYDPRQFQFGAKFSF
ncbi:MAG: TonB-dependent receptor [Acidobacteria bacterium]|nr:TonB-dependent receptor [Acidobacteriota bacterium]